MRKNEKEKHSKTNAKLGYIKVGFPPSKKIVLFASMIALQKWWKMLFISS